MVYSKQMFQGWHAPFCQIALNCWEISSSVVNLLIGLLETDVSRHGMDAPRAITIQSSEGHCCQAAGALSQHQHDLEQHISQVGFCKEEQKHLMKRSVSVVNRRTNTLRRSRIFSRWWPTQKQIKNCHKITPSVFITSMPFSFALSLSFFCRHDYDGASGDSSWHLWKIAVYNLTSYISPICLCV